MLLDVRARDGAALVAEAQKSRRILIFFGRNSPERVPYGFTEVWILTASPKDDHTLHFLFFFSHITRCTNEHLHRAFRDRLD